MISRPVTMLPMEPTILLASAWVAPMSGPMLRDGAVAIRGDRVSGVGPLAELRRQFPEAVIHDHGSAVILPGLVNAHVHLELSHLRPGDPPRRFVDWILDLMRRAHPADAEAGMGAGIAQCLRFGVTSVGDITSQPDVTRPVLSSSPLGGVSFGEVRAMAQRRTFLQARLDAAVEQIQSKTLRAGLSPHAPYSIEIDGYQQCLATARARDLPLATHLAETREEAEFLRDHTGPFKDLWNALNAWDEAVPTFDGGPIRFAKSIGLLDFPTLLAHVNYCDDAEMDLLTAGVSSVVYCPRTHAYFGHPPHRWREMLARGINVAVGTDSCASSPDLNLVDDLRMLHQIAPDVSVEDLWKLATVNGARAIQRKEVGSISPGKLADLVVFPAQSSEALREILESQTRPVAVWIGGRKVEAQL